MEKLCKDLSAEISTIVKQSDTALYVKSGDLEVLATPRLIALCEEACVEAIKNALDPSESTVGVNVHFDHFAPTAIGKKVFARAVLENIEGNRLIFKVSCRDERREIGAGVLTRAKVIRDEFLKKL